MISYIVEQTCEACGMHFFVKYYENSSYEYVSETCDCDCGFHPADGEMSISERIQSLEGDRAYYDDETTTS